MSELKKRPVIIDCDPGEDDAVCLFMMMASDQFDILGICPVNGNKPLSMTEKNALRLCELAHRTDIPVLKGAKKAIFKEQRDAGATHGDTGLGTLDLPEPTKKVEDMYAWDFYYEMAKKYPGELEILAVGPLTNIAIALLKYPELSKLVKHISIMGGAEGLGNYGNAAAEFNIWADPDGAKYVFNSGIPTIMAGLEICYKAVLTPEHWQELHNAGTTICAAAASLTEGRVKNGLSRGLAGGVLCDAVAAAYLIDPTLLTTEDVNVDVETTSQITEGKTVVTRHWTEHVQRQANCKLCKEIDFERFGNTLVTLCKALDSKIAE